MNASDKLKDWETYAPKVIVTDDELWKHFTAQDWMELKNIVPYELHDKRMYVRKRQEGERFMGYSLNNEENIGTWTQVLFKVRDKIRACITLEKLKRGDEVVILW